MPCYDYASTWLQSRIHPCAHATGAISGEVSAYEAVVNRAYHPRSNWIIVAEERVKHSDTAKIFSALAPPPGHVALPGRRWEKYLFKNSNGQVAKYQLSDS
ncbi:hypothetical protein EVAR_3541_1 [Eumeta japonica]|uniref:Uncharacterized protein n=1 Tax=Eumeta variegata TaxID=151549 RepID=A0A4C1SW78_EUMVA|nr:hypothetical protein EVAR_3541_1 [Eumeta japonica]